MTVCTHPDPTTCPCPDPYCYWCRGPANHESDDHPAEVPAPTQTAG